MRKTGYAHQIRKALRLRIHQHLTDESRAKFRDSIGAHGAADLFWCDAQRLRPQKEGQHLFIIDWNRGRIHPRQIHEHTDHRRVIVSQNIQLQKTSMQLMIIEMRRDRACLRLVGRILHPLGTTI